jgi:lipopolysaccharide transport system ATP-binding protein
MDKDLVIKVDGLYKKFTRSLKRSMAYGTADITRNMFGIKYDNGKLRKSEFWSLENVSFELKKGEALGIIGQNGSGKSTLLRLINGIYPPDKGSVSVRGKIGALIAVGAGFQPHMTGRENIYLNGTILGMSQKEIKEKFDKIIAFADIGDFMDAPVATYSSGMTIRLGFSIAIHSEPEILLADEILAVGDLGFALKCYRKIAEYREEGGSIILVSHGIQLIRNTCNQVLWLDKGKVIAYGDTQTICDDYENFILQKDKVTQEKDEDGSMGSIINTDPKVRISKVEFLDSNNQTQSEYKVGEPFNIRIHYRADRKVNKPIFTVSVANPENIQVISNYTNFDKFDIDSIMGEGYIDFKIGVLALKPSEYKCTFTLTENNDINNHLEWHDKAHSFVVSGNDYVSYGLINPFPTWELKSRNE